MEKFGVRKYLVTIWIVVYCQVCAGIDNDNSTVSFKEPGTWSQILEDWTLSRDSNVRQGKAMKYVDKGITVSYKLSGANKRDVSETDLYLLGAIEKLVYRVDFLEKRLRRAEELLYYVISGNSNANEPCPSNYTKVARNCYHFGIREFDWKSSASFCRGMGGNIVALETVEENQDIVNYLQTTKSIKNKSFWTGGLNPGLLWIWADSGRPVHKDPKETVSGEGRCLKLNYDPASGLYSYKGEDCRSRQRYICELTQDDEAANKIERTARTLIKTE